MKPTPEMIMAAKTDIESARGRVEYIYGNMDDAEKEEVGGQVRSGLLDATNLLGEASYNLYGVFVALGGI